MQLIYFSAVPWASFRQRPHEFAEWAHRRLQARVLWVEPYPVRLPALHDLSRPAARMPEAAPLPAWLQLLRPRAFPLEPFAAGRALNAAIAWPPALKAMRAFASQDAQTVIAVGKPSHLALSTMQTLGLPSLYDAMDDFPAFHRGAARWASERIEREIVRLAQACSTSSTYLAKRLSGAGARVEVVPNGLAAQRMPPAQRVDGGGPFGYVGTIGPWFDWDWVAQLARSWPQRPVHLHGPVYRKPTIALPANISLLPALPHPEALRTMGTFAAGLIPFSRTELTESVDPVKYYEYRALGLPVISTAFGEMRGHAQDARVLLTDEPSGARASIEALLAGADTAESVTAFRDANDWSARFEPLASILRP